MSLPRLLSAGLLLLATFAGPIHAQKAEAELFVRQEGDDVRAALRIQVAQGWHLYHEELGPADAIGLPTQVKFSGADVAWSKVRFPQPLKLDQPFGKDNKPTWIWGHEGTLVLYATGGRRAGRSWASSRPRSAD
jgi:DsbC/DsbD-like thiol-disulfide interchange protein